MPVLAEIALSPVGLSAAFAAGVISFVSPCVWPLVPAYLSYVSGVSFNDLADQTRRVTTTTAAFVLGFGAIFTALGAGAGAVGGVLTEHRRTLEIASGLLIVRDGRRARRLRRDAAAAGAPPAAGPQARRADRRGGRRRRLRDRLDALRGADAGRDPGARRPLRPCPRRGHPAGRLFARAGRAVPALGPALHARAREPRRRCAGARRCSSAAPGSCSWCSACCSPPGR